jgi:hypothetical protein
MEHGTVQLDATEQAMIAKQTAKDTAMLTRQLKHVRKTGFPTSQTVNEVLSVNGLIEFGRPTENILYNYYRLTDRALHFLQTGKLEDVCSTCSGRRFTFSGEDCPACHGSGAPSVHNDVPPLLQSPAGA